MPRIVTSPSVNSTARAVSGGLSVARSDRARRAGAVAHLEKPGDPLEDLSGAHAHHHHQAVGDDGSPDRCSDVRGGQDRRGVDRRGNREGDRIRRAQRLEEAAGLDGPGDESGHLVVVTGDDEAGAGDRPERRLAGTGHPESGIAGKE